MRQCNLLAFANLANNNSNNNKNNRLKRTFKNIDKSIIKSLDYKRLEFFRDWIFLQ